MAHGRARAGVTRLLALIGFSACLFSPTASASVIISTGPPPGPPPIVEVVDWAWHFAQTDIVVAPGTTTGIRAVLENLSSSADLVLTDSEVIWLTTTLPTGVSFAPSGALPVPVGGAIVPAGGWAEFGLGLLSVVAGYDGGPFVLDGGDYFLRTPAFVVTGGGFVIGGSLSRAGTSSLLVSALAVPAPGTLALLLSGLLVAGWRRVRCCEHAA